MIRKLKLKDSIYILKESEEIYNVIFTGIRKIKRFKVDYLVKRIISELKSEQTREDLLSKLNGSYDKKQIQDCLGALIHEGFIREYNPQEENERYSKQMSFMDEITSSWDETLSLQQRLEKSIISVFGIGGIGTWIVNGLYQIGIGKIKISDPDIIEKSNLNRQLFFNSEDVGKYKVDIIKEKIPDANIISFKKTISENENLEDIIIGSDFLINCADSPSVEETTKIIDKYATKYKIPYCVAGGYNMHLGMIGPIIIPGKTATFNDFLEYQQKNDSLSNLEKIKDIYQTGNLGPIAGAIANIQVMEIFKYLIGKGDLNINKFAEVNFMDLSINWKEFGKK